MRKMLRIALDHDGTFDEDTFLWSEFVVSALKRGHDVRFVTMRFPNEGEDIESYAKRLSIPIIYTSRQGKRRFCRDEAKWEPHIWIDDNPEFVCADSRLLFQRD